MRILLLGSTGQVGRELMHTLPSLGALTTVSRSAGSNHVFDLQDLDRLQHTLDTVAPDVIVNASAYTAVDKAESEPEQAMRLNAEVPATIGAWAARHGALVIHYSTDYVYDGGKPEPYIETDTPNPLSVYGRSKLAGDRALLASGCFAIILRVSWVYGLHGRNFLLTMQRLMHERDALSIVDDQIGAPTWSRFIAQHTTTVIAQATSARSDTPAQLSALAGIYHLAPLDFTSWYGFARAIRGHLGLACALTPIPTAEYPTPAQRPKNSRLDSRKIRATFGVDLGSWQAHLEDCLNPMIGGK